MENQPLFEEILQFIRKTFHEPSDFIPLHAPYFGGNEKKYVLDTIESTFVSSVGAYVNRFEEMMKDITGAKHAIAIVNGTTALHLALVVAGVSPGDLVLTQSLTFIATVNAISHAGARPVFLDVDKDTMGLSPVALQSWLNENAEIRNRACYLKGSNQKIAACMPMHTFGFPLRIDEVADVCKQYHITLVEDAAESIGSYIGDTHTGNFGLLGAFSFNGNKTVTSGGGGCVVTNDDELGKLAKHLSTTAKKPHAYEFIHDAIGYNYRMPNLNAALACAQLEQLEAFLINKRELAAQYEKFFQEKTIEFIKERLGTTANYWLNTLLMPDSTIKESFLKYSNEHNVMTRPVWQLIHTSPMYSDAIKGPLTNSQWLAERVVNIPSSVRLTTHD